MKLKAFLVAMAMMSAMVVPAVAEEVKGMMVLVTSPEPQTQLMSMVLSSQVVKQGKQVKVLVCGPAGDLVVKGSPETILKPKNKSPQMLMRNLIGKGVSVQVCPLYLPNKGKTVDDLIKGVSVAKPPMVAKDLMQPGIKLLNF